MTEEKDKKRVSEEVDNRLDAFFSDDDWGTPAPDPVPAAAPVKAAPPDDDDVLTLEAASAPAAPAVAADELGLNDLKVLVLSLDWEITDSTMEKMEAEAKRLKDSLKADAVASTYLSLLELLGKYVRVKKAEAHPDSVTLLREVYESLEQSLAHPEIEEARRKRSALSLVEKFNRIKKQIAATRPAKPRAAAAAAPVVEAEEVIEARPAAEEEMVVTAQPVAVPAGAVNLAAIKEEIVAALKVHLASELSAIRDEIRATREGVERLLAVLAGPRGADPRPSAEIMEDDGAIVLEAAPASGEDILDAAPIEAGEPARELPGAGELAMEEDLASELGLSMEEEPGSADGGN